MTANELADELENTYPFVGVMEVSATMLRQQQAELNEAGHMIGVLRWEIESLKEELKRYADAIGEERGNKALRNNEIAEILTKVLDDCGLLKKASEK
jgi:capsule polysaccharide export protein KpsE/RkpR